MNVTTQTSSLFQEVDTGAIRHGAIVDGRAQKLGRRRVAQLDISTDHAVAEVPSEHSALMSTIKRAITSVMGENKVIELGSEFYQKHKESIHLNYIGVSSWWETFMKECGPKLKVKNFKENSRNEILNIWFEAAEKDVADVQTELNNKIAAVAAKKTEEERKLKEKLKPEQAKMANLYGEQTSKDFEDAKNKVAILTKEIDDVREKNAKEKAKLEQKLEEVKADMKRLKLAQEVEHAKDTRAKTEVLKREAANLTKEIKDLTEKRTAIKTAMKKANGVQTELENKIAAAKNKNHKRLLEAILEEVWAEMAKLSLDAAEKDVEDLNNEIAAAKNAKEKAKLKEKLEEVQRRILDLGRCNC